MADVFYNIGLIRWNDWELPGATPVDEGYQIKIALIKNSYTPDKDHTTMSDVASHEVIDTVSATPTYYREVLGNRTEDIDNSSDLVKYDAEDITWTALLTDDPVDGIVLYLEWLNPPATPVDDTDSELLVYFDVDTTQPNGTDFTVQWDSGGVTELKQAP